MKILQRLTRAFALPAAFVVAAAVSGAALAAPITFDVDTRILANNSGVFINDNRGYLGNGGVTALSFSGADAGDAIDGALSFDISAFGSGGTNMSQFGFTLEHNGVAERFSTNTNRLAFTTSAFDGQLLGGDWFIRVDYTGGGDPWVRFWGSGQGETANGGGGGGGAVPAPGGLAFVMLAAAAVVRRRRAQHKAA